MLQSAKRKAAKGSSKGIAFGMEGAYFTVAKTSSAPFGLRAEAGTRRRTGGARRTNAGGEAGRGLGRHYFYLPGIHNRDSSYLTFSTN
jgi:hypothetical protein